MTATTDGLAEQGAKPPATLDAIAASLIGEAEPNDQSKQAQAADPTPPPGPGKAEDVQAPAPEPEAQADDAGEEDLVLDPGDDLEGEEGLEAEPAQAEEVEDPDILSVFDQTADQPAELSLEADVAYDVMIDGKTQQIKASELIRSFSTEGAIDKRLQDAGEARNKALADAQPLIDQSRAMHQRLGQALQAQTNAMFAERVARPDPTLQETDPIGFVGQMEAWRQDQERITTDKGHMAQIMHHADLAFQDNKRQVLVREAESIKRKLPSLKDPRLADVFRGEIATIGEAHGFTAEEIVNVQDHRILTLAAEAAAYRRLKAKLAPKPAAKDGARPAVRPAPTIRQPMKVGGKGLQTPRSRKAVARRKATAKAQQTGHVDDVALTLLI